MTGLIIKGVGGLYYVFADGSVYECSARGRFRKNRITPTAGDTVDFTVLDEDGRKGALERIHNRKNSLVRPRIANIDTAVITFAAASPSPNYDILDRFLVLAEKRGIENIVICINKAELAPEGFISEFSDTYGAYTLCFVSALENRGVDELRSLLKGVSVLAGPSGVGKTSLINALVPDSDRQTGEISRRIERGKHTTRQVELIRSSEQSFIADSPGFTSLSLELIEPRELAGLYREFGNYPEKCRFSDCAHISEPDCAVKEHIGEIPQKRYDSYVYIYNELKQRR